MGSGSGLNASIGYHTSRKNSLYKHGIFYSEETPRNKDKPLKIDL